MEHNGRLIKCDRCGKELFLKWISTDEFDGGYTRIDKFEDKPEGWNSVSRYLKKADISNLCPECSKVYEDWMVEFFNYIH